MDWWPAKWECAALADRRRLPLAEEGQYRSPLDVAIVEDDVAAGPARHRREQHRIDQVLPGGSDQSMGSISSRSGDAWSTWRSKSSWLKYSGCVWSERRRYSV